ncbi:MAG TPA: class E sortase [Acidimicrobiales bacterium]|nr:class E sortase [Acidimicrobiales bacterium]
MARRVVAGVGRALIGLGVLILLFVAYQLWGTNLSESSSQHDLGQQFQAELRSARPPASTTTTSVVPRPGGDPCQAAPAAPASAARPTEGQPLGIIRIPKIGVDKYFVEGTGEPDLKKGPGHYPGTPMPGETGNAAIAGHRTTYGAPFYNLNALNPGDAICVTTLHGNFTYLMTGSKVVVPTDVSVIGPTSFPQLTLTTCNPRFSAAQRLVIFARLDTTVTAALPAPKRDVAPVTAASPDVLTEGTSKAIVPTVGWGLGCIAVALLAWGLARRWRRLPAYLVAAPVFLVLLYFFFEIVSRILPSSI